jgi:hypothetical protein
MGELRVVERHPEAVLIDGGQGAGGRAGEVGDREADAVAVEGQEKEMVVSLGWRFRGMGKLLGSEAWWMAEVGTSMT